MSSPLAARRRLPRYPVRTALAVGIATVTLLGSCASAPTTVVARDLDAASPLAEFLDTPPRSQLAMPQLDEPERLRQDTLTELVAECMDAAGFEYVAVPLTQRLGEELLDAYELAPAEFAHRYGYGATTIEVKPYDDPNERIREELSESRQAEYDAALWGDPAEGGGCYLHASAQVYGDPKERETGYAEFAPLTSAINDLYRQIDADPRLAEGYRGWAACVAAAGYPGLAEPREARQSVFERLPRSAPVVDPESAGPDQWPAQPPDPQLLAEVRDYELALAPVDYECQRRHVLGPRRAVTMELEQQFLDAHRDELTRYRDWLAD